MKTQQERTNILVTGGAGTVGSNLCEYLLEQEKYNVICVDNYFSGSEINIDRLLSHSHFEFIRHDITKPLDFKKFSNAERFKAAFIGIKEIYHLANPDSPSAYLPAPVEVLMLGSAGTKNVLDLALQYRAKVLIASDTNVYGDVPSDEQITEDKIGVLDFLSKEHVLAQAKRTAEAFAETYSRLYSIEVKIVRMHNVYGPNMHFGDGRFIPAMIERALSNQPIFLTEKLTEAPFLYVSDAVDALARLMASDARGVYNLAHPSQYSIDEVVNEIVRLSGSQSAVQRGASPMEKKELYAIWEQYCRPIATAKIKDHADWFPVVLLRDGLLKTIDYMKSTRGLADLRSARRK